VVTVAAGMSDWLPIVLGILVATALIGALAAHVTIARSARAIVLVGPHEGVEVRSLRWALDEEWFEVQGCPGPEARACPVLRGETCPLHGHPAGVVIFRGRESQAPIPPCEAALGAPAIIVEDTGTPPRDRTTIAWTGDADRAVQAVEALIRERGATAAG
jgi:hypothetical protein